MAERTERLRDALEDEILMGRLRPGDRLDEVALAARYGVSRTPIREAFFQLSAAGLIEHRPRRGTFVARIGPERLLEMFEVMAELEALAAGRAARRAAAEEIGAIRSLHEACRAAATTGDADAYYYRNEDFHAAIRTACRNAFLIEQADALQKRLKPYRRAQLRARDRVRRSFAEHEAIVCALEAGEADIAAATMRGHVTVQSERFSDLMATVTQMASTALD